ncbi:unnamed protein product, partial [Musa acuminata var. zebrina]
CVLSHTKIHAPVCTSYPPAMPVGTFHFFGLKFYRSIGNLKDVLSSIYSYMDNELIIIF